MVITAINKPSADSGLRGGPCTFGRAGNVDILVLFSVAVDLQRRVSIHLGQPRKKLDVVVVLGVKLACVGKHRTFEMILKNQIKHVFVL